MRALIIRTKEFVEQNERLLSGAALAFGFVVDSLTLRRIDLLAENLVLIGYFAVAVFSIIVLAHREREYVKHKILAWSVAFAPLALQVAFGALFSAFVIFYSRSAALSASWPFIIFLVGMLVGNEAFRPRYERLVFQMSVLFVGLLSYAIMFVPVLTGSIGTLEFLGSIVVAVGLLAAIGVVIRFVAPKEMYAARHALVRSVGGIVVAYLIAYGINLLPAAPLALTDSAVAHELTRSGDEYVLSVEPRTFRDRLSLSEEYHRTFGEPVYVWTSIFAPTKLATPITHEWQRYEDGRWKTKNRITFPITGGRDEGYRGYTMKESVAPGAWRVSVETPDGSVIGRVRFDVVEAKSPVTQMRIKK